MFTTLIVQPIFNLLVLIYAVLPGHNFGLAIIIFTIIVRMLLWPLVKKQLHQTKKMRKIQPELKRIVKETKGNKQLQLQMQMELYKERNIKPFAAIGPALLQLPILFGLYLGLQRVIKDPYQMVDFAYPALQNLHWLEQLKANISLFDSSLFGIVDLTRPAIGTSGLYIPALIIVAASAVTQYFQAKQLMPQDKEARGLRAILKDAGQGTQADQSEVSAAIGQSTKYFLPVIIFVTTIGLPSALGLYWFVSGLVAFLQQSYVLREDGDEMQAMSEPKPGKKNTTRIPEAEVISNKTSDTTSVASSAPLLPGKQQTKAARNQPVKQSPKLADAKPFKAPSGSTVTSITRSKKGKK